MRTEGVLRRAIWRLIAIGALLTALGGFGVNPSHAQTTSTVFHQATTTTTARVSATTSAPTTTTQAVDIGDSVTGEEFDNRIYGVPSTAPATSTSSTATTATTATTAVADTTVVASTPSTPAIAADAVSSTRRTNGPLIALALLAAVGGLSLSGYVLVRRRQ